jgi:hypothetical protein
MNDDGVLSALGIRTNRNGCNGFLISHSGAEHYNRRSATCARKERLFIERAITCTA